MKVTIKSYAYILRDARNNFLTRTVEDGSDYICASGYDKNGEYQCFDGKAWNLREWADEYGMTATSQQIEFVIDVEMPQLYANGSMVYAWAEDCEVLGYNAESDLYELKASWGIGYEQPKHINLK